MYKIEINAFGDISDGIDTKTGAVLIFDTFDEAEELANRWREQFINVPAYTVTVVDFDLV